MQINSTLLIVLLYCTLQVVFLGDSSVGKTCLARLLTEEKVQPTTDNTIGFDLHSKELIVDGVRVIVSETDIHQMIKNIVRILPCGKVQVQCDTLWVQCIIQIAILL